MTVMTELEMMTDEVANILLSLNRKNTSDNSCNDKEDKNSEGKNKGDKMTNFMLT